MQVRPGVWRLRVFVGTAPNGNPIQASTTFHGGSRAADDELRKFISRVQRTRSEHRTITLGGLLDAWLENVKRSVTGYTLQNYEYVIEKRIKPKLGPVRIDKLKATHLDRAYREWLDEGLSPSTVRKTHNVISAALNQAKKWEWVERPVTELASPPQVTSYIDRAIQPEELIRMIELAGREEHPVVAAAITLAAATGARRGELCALRWSNLDLQTSILTIAGSLSVLDSGEMVFGRTKTKKPRQMFLGIMARDAMDGWREWQIDFAKEVEVPLDPDPFILSDQPRGHRPILPNTLTHRFTRLSRKLGLPYHFHELRHFAATQMLVNGIDAKMAATRLGHADPWTTLRYYTHATTEADRRAAESIGKALTAANGGVPFVFGRALAPPD